MEYFWTDGGNNRPYFRYRIKVPECTAEMYRWCEQYDDEGEYFRRWHVEWKTVHPDKEYEVVQFEWEQAAIMFALSFNIK
jgi:hypothetical protein